MKKEILLFIVIAGLLSCSKEEKNDLVWEKALGKGAAFFITATADSGFIAAGQVNGNPYLIKYDYRKDKVAEIEAVRPGLFSSVWADTSGFIAAGSSNSSLSLYRFDADGNQEWEFMLDTTVNIEIARMKYEGSGNFLVLGTPDADSLSTGDKGFLFLRFDTTGKIKMRKLIAGSVNVSSSNFDTDEQGNIYVALTRQVGSAKPRSSVAKYSADFNKLWETELFNNPEYSSASLALRYVSGKIFVAGRTEMPGSTGTVMNSFVLCLSGSGQLSGTWSDKKYPEFWNEGYDIGFNKDNNLLMLNRKCFIINVIDPDNGTDLDIIRPFSVCVSESSDALANDFDVSFDGRILLAGSLGGSFYVAIK